MPDASSPEPLETGALGMEASAHYLKPIGGQISRNNNGNMVIKENISKENLASDNSEKGTTSPYISIRKTKILEGCRQPEAPAAQAPGQYYANRRLILQSKQVLEAAWLMF